MNHRSTISPRSEDCSAIVEINSLHAGVILKCQECGQVIHEALNLAWKAGLRLSDQKVIVRKTYGHGAWEPWLKNNFHGSVRTAQRYMYLAKNVTDVSYLEKLTLRQAYRKLGLAGKSPELGDARIPSVPEHVRLTNRFLRWSHKFSSPKDVLQNRDSLRRDLKPIYDWLRPLFSDEDKMG